MRRLMDDAKAGGVSKPEEEVFPIYEDYMDDVDGGKLVDRMQKNGYEKTVICVVDNSDEGKTDDEALKMNEKCASVATRHTGKLLSLASIDPRRPNAAALFRRCIEEFGMDGLKWHPDDGYYPNSCEAYRVLEMAETSSVPLLTSYRRGSRCDPRW